MVVEITTASPLRGSSRSRGVGEDGLREAHTWLEIRHPTSQQGRISLELRARKRDLVDAPRLWSTPPHRVSQCESCRC